MQTTFDEKIFSLGCQEFYFTIASNSQLLQKGYEIVYKYLSLSTQNREQTLLHLLSEKAPVLTLVTRTYPIVYADNSVGITAEQKLKTKQFLILEVLMKQLVSNYGKQKYANKKNLSNLLLFLIHFHNNQGFEGWVAFYEKLLEELIKINSDLIGYILIEILKNSDDRVSCFSKHILPFVINNQSNLKISEQDSLQILYYCIKSMAYMNGTEDEVLQQYFEPYEEKILEYIFTSISKSMKIMKYSLKILTVFVADYQIQIEKEMISKLKQCSKQLVIEHLGSRLQQTGAEELDDQDLQEQNNTTISIIIYQLIELFETLLTNQQMKMADYEVFLGICLPSLLLSRADYLSYSGSTETYLAEIQDEAQKNLRNKVVSFFLQLYEGQYPTKTKAKLQTEVLKYSLILQSKPLGQQKFGQQLITFFTNIGLPISIQKQHLLLFEQSLTFLLYHLTEDILTFDTKNLEQNKQSLMMSLGKNIELSVLSNDRLIKVSYMNLLNKLIKSMSKSVKQAFYQFLVESIHKVSDFEKDKGFILSLCRGFAYVSNDVPLSIVQSNAQNGIPILMLENLVKYILDPNTLQQSAHLILQFFLTLLKKVLNASIVLKTLIASQVQIHMLSTFVHDGTIADVVIDVLSQIASPEFITYIYVEFAKGTAKQQNLALLIAQWVKLQLLPLTQKDLRALLKAYNNQFVAKIIKEFLCLSQRKKLAQNLSPYMVGILNDTIHPSWVLPMIGCNILRNPETLLLNTINTITYELTSQYEIENQLLLPYYTFINDPRLGVNLMKSKSQQFYDDFLNKLIRYATLFQGPNLKIITSHVLLNICEVDHQQIKPVFELISSYGKTTETDEWEDQQEKDEENVIDRMFNMKLTNDQVEKQFAQIFENIVYDMTLVNAKVNQLSALIKQ